MKKLFIFLLGLTLFSCSQKICLTRPSDGESRTFKFRGDVVIDDEHVHFTTVKGTKQSVPKDLYEFEIE